MLANITSLFWGSPDPTTQSTTPTSPSSKHSKTACDISADDDTNLLLPCLAEMPLATTIAEEGDWVFVDGIATPPCSIRTASDAGSVDGRSETNGCQAGTPQGRPLGSIGQRTNELLQAIDGLRPAQKAQRRREERRLKHKQLERHNKAREVEAAGNSRSRRRDLLTPNKCSRAVNNRKC